MNDEEFDKLTEQAFGLFIKYCEENNYKDKNFNYYKNLLEYMETIEKNAGILTKDFIKKLIDREKELENEVFELKEKLKATKSTSNNEVPLGYNIFLNMIKYATVNFSNDLNYNVNYNGNITLGPNMPTMSIADYPLNPDEFDYIAKIIENDRKPYIKTASGVNIVDSYGNLADDRAWP